MKALNTRSRRTALFIGMAIGAVLFYAAWPGATIAEAAKAIYWIGIALLADWYVERRMP